MHTGFINQHQANLFPKRKPTELIIAQLALSVLLKEQQQRLELSKANNQSNNPFYLETGFRINHKLVRKLTFIHDDGKFQAVRTLVPVGLRILGKKTFEYRVFRGKE